MSLTIPLLALVDDLDLLMQYLVNLDWLGFFIACFTTRTGSEMFYSIIMLAVSVVIYNRSQSLGYCVGLWLLIGSLGILTAAPGISGFGILFISLSLIFVVYRLVFT